LEILFELFLDWIWFLWFQTADIDERSIRREDPEELVMVLAEAKVESFFLFVHLFYVCNESCSSSFYFADLILVPFNHCMHISG
jgi:hypothetical protein